MKKGLIFVGALILILLITIIVPKIMYNKYATAVYFTQVKNDQGAEVPNTMYLTSKISKEIQNPADISNLEKEYRNILEGKNKDTMNLFFTLGIIIILSLSFTACVLIKDNHKLLGSVFVTSAILNFLYYLAIYYIAIIAKVVY